MKLKVLDRDDVAHYKSIRLESLKESPFAFSDSYNDLNASPNEEFQKELAIVGNPPEAFVLAAVDDKGKIQGFVRFKRDQRQKARHKSMVHSMYITPEFRGRGVGKLMMENVIERAKSLRGLEQIHLWVLHHDSSASGFYRKLGFEQQGPLVRKDLKAGNIYVDAEYQVHFL